LDAFSGVRKGAGSSWEFSLVMVGGLWGRGRFVHTLRAMQDWNEKKGIRILSCSIIEGHGVREGAGHIGGVQVLRVQVK